MVVNNSFFQKRSFLESITSGINFLFSHQLPYGEFKVYACPNREMNLDCYFDSSVFATTQIMYCLNFISDPLIDEMIKKSRSFLSEELVGPGMFQYYSSRNSRKLAFDLDDTSCASFSLRNNHPFIQLRYNINHIINNRNQDGLFYTWLGIPEDKNDVDSVVNANVICYLGTCQETENSIAWLIDIVLKGNEKESYHFYLDDFFLYYAISRAYFNGVTSLSETKETIFKRILERQSADGSFGDNLITAIAMSTLLNFGFNDKYVLEKTGEYLISRQFEDGSWGKIALFIGPESFYGSEELTSALCLEALAHFKNLFDS
jgi:hypothetical protein